MLKNLETGEFLKWQNWKHHKGGKTVWAADNQHFFYIRKDETLRAFQIYRHKNWYFSGRRRSRFGWRRWNFDVSVYKSKSLEYIFITKFFYISDEHWFIPSDDVLQNGKSFKKKTILEYAVDIMKMIFTSSPMKVALPISKLWKLLGWPTFQRTLERSNSIKSENFIRRFLRFQRLFRDWRKNRRFYYNWKLKL